MVAALSLHWWEYVSLVAIALTYNNQDTIFCTPAIFDKSIRTHWRGHRFLVAGLIFTDRHDR